MNFNKEKTNDDKHNFVYTPHFNGVFYDKNYEKQIIGLLDKGIKPDPSTKAILVPHASYKYSGKCLINAYQHIDWKNINNIVILSTSHYSNNKTILPNFNTINFNNHIIKVPAELNKLFIGDGVIVDKDNIFFNKEHSFETQLPAIIYFNKDRLDKIKIYPILIGDLKNYKDFANILLNIFNNQSKTIFIINSDFTHFGPNYDYPPKSIIKSLTNANMFIRKKDAKDVKSIINGNMHEFEKLGESVCGKYAILLWMQINKILKLSPKLVCYATSFGNKKMTVNDNSVSYIGLIYNQPSTVKI